MLGLCLKQKSFQVVKEHFEICSRCLHLFIQAQNVEKLSQVIWG